jgi:hypothetical protein
MRHLRLAGLLGAVAVGACVDSLPPASKPDTALALHFDTLTAEANSAGQPNRVAALDLTLRTLADGANPALVALTTGSASDSAMYSSVVWSIATAKVDAAGQDSVTDSLMVFLAWRTSTPDTIVVARLGDLSLATPEVEDELATLGLTTSMANNSGASGALVIGNTVSLADSGRVSGGYAVLGGLCQYVTVTSIANDYGTSCNTELFDWSFSLRFSPSDVWGLSAGASQGIVILQ